MEVEIRNIEALVAKLRHLGENIDEIVDGGLQQGAQKIQRTAKTLIRQKGAYDTGNLHRNIVIEKIAKGYAVGTNVKYAPFIEFGTGTRGDPSVSHTQRETWRYKDSQGNWHTAHAMRPRPYMRPAFENNKTYVVKSIRNALMKRLRERISR